MNTYPELLDIDNGQGLVTVRITPTQLRILQYGAIETMASAVACLNDGEPLTYYKDRLNDIDAMMSRVDLRQAYEQRYHILGITPYRYKPYRYWEPGRAKTLFKTELERLRREQTAGKS